MVRNFFKKRKYTTFFFAAVIGFYAFIEFFTKSYDPESQTNNQRFTEAIALLVILAVLFFMVRYIDKHEPKKNKT